MALRAQLTATGSYLPKKKLSNNDLESIVDTSDEWIVQRSGIRNRHIAEGDETTAYMGAQACLKALDLGNIDAGEIDAIIVATTTPDKTFPAVAVDIQQKIGAPVGVAFDVQAVCSGFVYALSIADNMITSGQVKNVLVVGSERMSSILNWEDRGTCVLFGDGAGAVLLQAAEATGDNSDSGVLHSVLKADGKLQDILYTDGGVKSGETSGEIVMQGREVFKNAVAYLSEIVEDILEISGFDKSNIDWLIPHQANIRIIESTAKKLNLPMDKVVVTLENHGNTSAASIPLALDVAYRSGQIKKGDLGLLEALGGGLTWGALFVRF